MSQDVALNGNGAKVSEGALKVVFYPPISPVESSLCVLLSILPEFAILDHVPSKERGVKVSVVNYLP